LVPTYTEDNNNNKSDGRCRTTRKATNSQLDAKLSGNQ
jgi:hypothetical protein